MEPPRPHRGATQLAIKRAREVYDRLEREMGRAPEMEEMAAEYLRAEREAADEDQAIRQGLRLS